MGINFRGFTRNLLVFVSANIYRKMGKMGPFLRGSRRFNLQICQNTAKTAKIISAKINSFKVEKDCSYLSLFPP